MHLKATGKPFAHVPEPVGPDGTYRPVSFWQETVSVQTGAPFAGNRECDVAIVGGGFTGLSTAYELKRRQPGLSVALLERAVVGHGASGRNGGFAMPLIGWDLVDVVKKLGAEQAAATWRLTIDSVRHLVDFIRESGIDCDMETSGYVLLATCARREARLRAEYALAQEFGFEHRWLGRAELDQYIRSPHFTSGLFDPVPVILNPAKLARGLKDVVETMGVDVFEQTPLVELIDGDPVTLRVPGGTIRARRVVLGVNGYGASLGFLAARILPVHTFIVLTEPVGAADLERIGWAERRASLETSRNFIHYFRLTSDNRILFGGEDASLYFGGTYRDMDEPICAALESRFRAYFPSLSHVRITHRWGGVLGVTLDMFPTFGVGGRHQNIFHAAGYSGHGVALSNYAGRILAPMILGESATTPQPFFLGRLPFPVPPEPARYLGLQAYRAVLRMLDRWQGA